MGGHYQVHQGYLPSGYYVEGGEGGKSWGEMLGTFAWWKFRKLV